MVQHLIERKRTEVGASVEKWSTQLTSKPDDYDIIIHSTASEIVRAISVDRKWTAEQVMRAHCYRCIEVHKAVNCCTVFMFDRALERARLLDAQFARTGKPIGRLHGVPLSVKDHVNVKGYDATSAYSRFLFTPVEKDCLLVQVLEAEGAIAFCKTNVPQLMMTFECNNPVFGRTLNPLNTRLSPGGSSGGEAALITAFGSPLGVGSDIGGSLRIPSHFTGICTLKSSFGRVPITGQTTGHRGQEAVKAVLGPMARSVEDLETFMRVVVESETWTNDNLTVLPIPWLDIKLRPKLRFGYYETDGFLDPTPACQRAVRETVKALRQAGHDVVPFKPPNAFEIVKSFFGLMGADGGKTFVEALGNDPREVAVGKVLNLYRTPYIVKYCLSALLHTLGQTQAAELIVSTHECSVQQLWKLQTKRQELFVEFYDAFAELELDGVIAPVHVHPATPHDTFGDMSFSACYTLLYNVLDATVGVLPVTKVDKHLDAFQEPVPSLWNALWSGKSILKVLAYQHYDLNEMHGMPVGVQIFGGRLQEEKTLKLMRVAEEALQKSK